MLKSFAKHGFFDLTVKVKGDLYVDCHHTIEDTGIAIGECIRKALGDKRGIERYGYTLPMDDCLCQVALDFGGRPWIVWDAEFKREKIGEMPTEMFFHFFKSLSDAALMNLNIKAEGTNEHHKIEGIFKAFARSVKMAVKRDIYRYELPSTKSRFIDTQICVSLVFLSTVAVRSPAKSLSVICSHPRSSPMMSALHPRFCASWRSVSLSPMT